MDNEVIIEENKIVENKNFNKKAMLTYAICGFVISAVVIVVAILYFVKVMPRSIAMHIMYPGISVNLLINGFSMLKYGDKKERVITGLKRISKPGLRVYAKSSEVPRVLNGLGIAIISTSKGIMTDKDARKNSLGGEVLAYIW